MKKLIFTILFLLIAFTGFWFYSAHRIEGFIATKLAKAEEELLIRGFKLKHEGLSVSGFPFGYDVKIKSPSLKRLKQNGRQYEFLNSAALDGYLSLTSNLLGSKFTIRKDGNGRFSVQNMQKNGIREDLFIATGNAGFTFSAEEDSYVEAIKNPFKALFELLEKNEKEFLVGKKGVIDLKNIKLANAENEGFQVIALDNGEIRYNISDLDEKEMSLRLSGEIKGLDLDTLIMGSDSFTPGSDRSLKEIALLLSMPKPGKTDITFDLDAKLPSVESSEINQNPTFANLPAFSIDLKKATISNNFGSNYLKGITFLTHVKEGKRQLHHNLIGTFENSKEQFDALRATWEEFLSNLPICQENATIKASSGCPVIKSLIPKFDTFGKITFQTDFDFDVHNLQAPLENSKLDLRHLDYFAEIYGLKSDGKAAFTHPDVMNLSYKINLLNYQDLLKDLFGYLKKVEQFLPYLTEEATSLPKLSENQLILILTYLKAISDEPEKDLKDIRISVSINENNSFKIGTLTAPEFEKKTTELLEELAKDVQVKQ